VKIQDAKSRRISLSGHHRTTLSGYIFATEVHIENRKKNLLSSNMSCRCGHNMVNFGPPATDIGSDVWGTPTNFNGFASWQRYCTVLQQWASAKLCGVEQRAPPIFGRATISPSRWALAHILVIFGQAHLYSRTDSQALRAEYCVVGIPHNTAIQFRHAFTIFCK